MKSIQENGETVFLIEGPDPSSGGAKTFGILKRHMEEMRVRGSKVRLAYLIKIVGPSLIMAHPIFEGANRPLNYEGDMDGADSKLFFTIMPKCDYGWVTRPDQSTELIEMAPPPDSVFVVAVTPSTCQEHPSVDFWLENWTWVDEDDSTPGFPIHWKTRYDRQITRPSS